MKKSTKIMLSAAAGAAAAGGLYALSLRGRKDHPAFAVLKQYRYAHRGYHDKPAIPENSMPAFRRAVERGWGAELDVHLIKDGTLVVFHDSDLKRCTGAEGKIEDLTFAELLQLRLEGTNEQIPTFNQVLDVFEGKTPLIIELKPANGNEAELAKAVCERLDRYQGDFCIESFNPNAIREVAKLRPDICRGQLAENFFKNSFGLNLGQQALGTNLSFNCVTQPDFVAYRFEDRKQPANILCRKLWGVQPVYWTIRSREDLAVCELEGAIPIFEGFDPDAD